MNKPLLNYSFSTREKGLIITLVIVALLALYFFVVVQNVATATAASQEKSLNLQEQIATQQAIANSRDNMQSEIESLGNVKNLPQVATYDNIRKEFNMLNGIFKSSESYTLTFSDPQLSGTTVRRVAQVAFDASSYKEAENLIRALEKGPYRCQVDDVNMDGTVKADGKVGDISVNMTVTFFETTDGATSLAGLQSAEGSSSTSNK